MSGLSGIIQVDLIRESMVSGTMVSTEYKKVIYIYIYININIKVIYIYMCICVYVQVVVWY